MREVYMVADDVRCRTTLVRALIVVDERNQLAYRCERCGFEGDLREHFMFAVPDLTPLSAPAA